MQFNSLQINSLDAPRGNRLFRVLLLQPPPPSAFFSDSLPLGLTAIASFLRKHGFKTDVLDLGKSPLPEKIRPDIIGIGASTPFFKNSIKLCKEIRRKFPDTLLILGGPHFTACPEDAPSEADAVVVGEGETAMLTICREGIRGKRIEEQRIETLDEIPIEDEDLQDVLYKGRQARLHILGSRGCPFSCAFCAEHSRRIRLHSPEYVVENVKRITSRYHNTVLFGDDIFTLERNWAATICESLLREKVKLKFYANGHVRHFDRELLRLMKKAGLTRLSYGIESGSNQVLKLIKKRFTVEIAEETIARTEEAGIDLNLLYMVGNIGDTESTISDTVKFALHHNTQKWCSYAVPFPGTEFRTKAARYGTILSSDFDNYNNSSINYLPHGVSAEYLQQARNAILSNLHQQYSIWQRAGQKARRLFG